jgi:hypothetical protein
MVTPDWRPAPNAALAKNSTAIVRLDWPIQNDVDTQLSH